MKLKQKKSKYIQQSLLLRQKRSIAPDKKAIARALISLIVLGILLTSTTLFYVWSRVEVVSLNYAIQEASKEERRLFMKHERLNVELATLMSPSRLSYLATREFNLKNPTNEQIIYMK